MVEVDKILEYAQQNGAQEAEIISETIDYKYARFELGEPKKTFSGITTEYALRVAVDNSVGFSYFTGDWKNAVKETVSLARAREKDERWSSFPTDGGVNPLNLYRASVRDASVDRVIQDMMVVHESTEHEKIVASNIDLHLGCSASEVANTNGIHRTDTHSLTLLRVMCRAADGDYGMGYSYAFSLGYDIDLQGTGENARKKALSQLGKQKTESGKIHVVMAPRVFANLLVCAAMPSFLGHNVVEGRSALTVGREIAAEHLKIREDPLVEAPPGRCIDDEGVPSRSVDLIEKGCVQNFLYDNYYGETTGNGIRYSRYSGRRLRDPPKPCATSLAVSGDTAPLSDIISEIDHGILIEDETNSHASKPQSGLFSIAVSAGFIIEDGEIAAPVKRCMVSGLAFEDLLPNVVALSKEKELHRNSTYPTFVNTGYAVVDSLQVTA